MAATALRIDVVGLFPDFIAQCADFGVIGRARARGLLSLHGWNPRDYARGHYRRVDDRPFGGGPGMVMLIDPLRDAIQAARNAAPPPAHVICMSPQGQRLTQPVVRTLAQKPRLILVCGRYEGIDERLLQTEVDQELSIGDYVLSGGELAAAVVVDAVARLRNGVLNTPESATQDSFEGDGLLDCPHYTRPVEHALGRVPDVLLSGHHSDIAHWRRQQALKRTLQRRPDLLETCMLSAEERTWLDAIAQQAASPPNVI